MVITDPPGNVSNKGIHHMSTPFLGTDVTVFTKQYDLRICSYLATNRMIPGSICFFGFLSYLYEPYVLYHIFFVCLISAPGIRIDSKVLLMS